MVAVELTHFIVRLAAVHALRAARPAMLVLVSADEGLLADGEGRP